MDRRRLGYALSAVVVLALLVYLGFATGVLASLLAGYDASNPGASGYEHTDVTVVDADSDEELGRVDAAVADTFSKRYVGLSDTESLADDQGMLFVHDGVAERTYVMREMEFGLDIVFVDSDGTITEIHEAPAPGPDENGNEQQYIGTGQYVLEVNRGWTDDRGVEVGDRLVFEV
ncbi:DUF192 domain-containing protein [Natronomonas gomsonensis]|uniref:DUF192 domain-containing protein n=1 Tax=Natronomonas gomsonensis TaxID=1046043 RepID=UPI0015BE418C|nr:DUF192 domain-containing protein [Natronomonas gomsonensis]